MDPSPLIRIEKMDHGVCGAGERRGESAEAESRAESRAESGVRPGVSGLDANACICVARLALAGDAHDAAARAGGLRGFNDRPHPFVVDVPAVRGVGLRVPPQVTQLELPAGAVHREARRAWCAPKQRQRRDPGQGRLKCQASLPCRWFSSGAAAYLRAVTMERQRFQPALRAALQQKAHRGGVIHVTLHGHDTWHRGE